MKRRHALPILLTILHLLAGCASFEDRPLDPAASVARIEARSLADEGLRQFIESLLGAMAEWPPQTWNLDRLTLAALYYHPDLALARAQAETADAAAITAAQRPNPFITLTPNWIRNLASTAIPLIAASSISIPIETAGKRGFRMDRAGHLADAAHRRVADAAWQARGRVRSAMLEVYAAQTSERLAQQQLALQEAIDERLQRQLAAGEIGRPEIIRSRLAVEQLRLNLGAAQKRRGESLAGLAAAVGLPAGALAPSTSSGPTVALDFADLAQPAALDAIPITSLRDAALRERPDVSAALAEYAAAQAALQLEIANQYPNIQANPGYTWDLGEHRWALGAMVGLPILQQNQGPIAEAEARRREAAVRFEALQTKILGDIDRSRAGYAAALAKLATADAQLAVQRDHRDSTQAWFRAGEIDRVALLAAELEGAAAERARLDVLVEAQQALGALEDSLRYPVASTLTQGVIADSLSRDIAP